MASISAELLSTFSEVGSDLYRLGLVSSHGGNLSVRVGHEMWITGTGTMLGRLRERHISLVKPDGAFEGPPPSSDTLLHSTIYALGGAGAVVHAHTHHAIAMSVETDRFVPPDFEGQHFLEDVPVIAQGPNQVAQVAAALQSRLVAILQGHGAYARGQTHWEALHWITALEESAHIAWLRR
jgi:L-fuculose-phosphate aldolase